MKTGCRLCFLLVLLIALCSTSPLLAQSPLIVTNPTTASVWAQGGTYTVTWSGGGAGWPIYIQLLDMGFINMGYIAVNIPNSGSETYTVPPTVPAGIYYVYVEGIDQGNSLGWGISEPFTILEGSVDSESATWGSVKAFFK